MNVTPILKSPTPIGTIAEAEQEGLDPTVYATCARPNKIQGIVGCPFHDKCRVSAKAQSGPKFYGVDIMHGEAQEGGFARSTVDCMWIASHIEDIERNGGSLSVIAEEGETYDKVTSVLVNNQTGLPTENQYDRDAHRAETRVKVKVGAWPRPSENRDLLKDVLRSERAQAERERRTSDNLAKNLGLSGTITPVDKRNAGQSQGRAKAEGGKS